MQNLRLVLLDYPKLILTDDSVREAFIDMIQAKQLNFGRTSETYVTLDPLDMISTHVLIYDTANLYRPKPVLAIRICYEDRAKKHGLMLPIDNYYKALPPEGIERFTEFRKTKPNLIDCNAWFVDSDYTYSKTKLPLSDIGFFAVALFIRRKLSDHLSGCSNEQFKASRWVNNIGNLVAPVQFIHPKVPTIHQLVLIDGFSDIWFRDCFTKYASLVAGMYELLPAPSLVDEPLLSTTEILEKISLDRPRLTKVA